MFRTFYDMMSCTRMMLVILAALLACTSPTTSANLPALHPAVADPAAAGSAPLSDDPFMAFLAAAGIDLGAEAPLAAPDAEADASAGASESQGADSRIKRTGSALGPLLNSKLAYLSKGSHHVHYHNYPAKCDKVHWSWWDFKKAVLQKLFEAAKAIGGGVLALKGKLLTLKGHIVEVKGRKLAEKGVALADYGKQVIAKVIASHVAPHTAVHSGPSAPSGPSGPAAGLGVGPSAYGHIQAPPVHSHPLPPHGGYLPTGHGGGHVPTGHGGQPSGGGYEAAAALLDEFNGGYGGYDASSQHRRGATPPPGAVHAGLLVLQPLNRHANTAYSPRSTAPGLGVISAPDMMSSASETSEEHVSAPGGAAVAEPIRLPASHTPLVLAPEVIDSLTTEIGAALDAAEPQVAVASPSETSEKWVAPPAQLPVQQQTVVPLPSRLLPLPAGLTSHVQTPEAAMARVVAKLHGQSSVLAGATSRRRRR